MPELPLLGWALSSSSSRDDAPSDDDRVVVHSDLGESIDIDAMSPELALVDPTLAAHARSWLPCAG